MINILKNTFGETYNLYSKYRQRRRIKSLRKLGMQIGSGVYMSPSVWIDISHCFLISIGDNCGFSENCVIYAHDGLMNFFIDATKVGFVKINDYCLFGMNTVILPGVEIGPRSLIGLNSVVTSDIPPNSVASGNPAEVICSLDHYLNKNKKLMEQAPIFPFREYDDRYLNSHKKEEMKLKLKKNIGYITGGYTAMQEQKNKFFYRS